MHHWLQRMYARWVIWRNTPEDLNRRVEIENRLLAMAEGKAPLPDREECRVLALKLGTRKRYWPKEWKR